MRTNGGSMGRSRIGRRLWLAGGAFSLLAVLITGALAVGAPAGPALANGGSGGCPSSNAIANYELDSSLTAQFTINGNGSQASYLLTSTDEGSSGGVPGLIAYCVYPNGTLPGSASAVAIGADGTAFTVSSAAHQGYFAFERGLGNPSNLPFDGSSDVVVGTASWPAQAPTMQAIVLHINDPSVCRSLYGGNPGTCFVLPTLGTETCSVAHHAPAALHIRLASPVQPKPAGSTLTLEYEMAVVNYTSADLGATVYVPTAKFVLPLSGGGELVAVDAPQTLTVAGAGWSSPVAHAVTLASTTAFSATRGYLTTSNLAVMAQGPSGLEVEFRWGWISNVSGLLHQSWSTPSSSASYPDYPSLFPPAPWVGVVSTSGTSAAGGTYYGIVLEGAVAPASFCTTIETPTGHELHGQVQSDASTTATTFEVGVPLTYANTQPLAAGSYLIHIHDAMGAIVIQVSVTVT